MRTVLVREGRELEVVQEDKHFSTHYQVRPVGGTSETLLLLMVLVRADGRRGRSLNQSWLLIGWSHILNRKRTIAHNID